jgi:hypothetical protein
MPMAGFLTGPSRGPPHTGRYAHSHGEVIRMLDLLMVAMTVALFALMFLAIRWFDRI